MKEFVVRDTIDHISNTAILTSAASIVAERSVLIVTRSGILAHSLPVAINSVEVTVNQDLKALTPGEGVSSDYVAFALKASERAILDTCVKDGTTVHSVEVPSLLAFEVPIAPTREQHRIVAKIEELFSKLDKAVESLKLARAQLKTYRKALLKAAFEGKLTADWRAANPDKIELPAALLARIRAERDACYKQALTDWQTALSGSQVKGTVGRRAGKPSRPRELSGKATDTTRDGPWLQVELGDVIAVSSGEGLTSADMRAGPYPVYGGNGIAGHHDQWHLSDPTLVIGRVGAKCGVTHITLPKAWVTDNALIVRSLIKTFEIRFFKYLLEYLNLNALGSSTGQPVISGSKIYGQLIALPSKAEQGAVADLIDASDTVVQATDEEIQDALARIVALRQSILKQAFSGQLVAQDVTDEPAALILARLRGQSPVTRTRRRRIA